MSSTEEIRDNKQRPRWTAVCLSLPPLVMLEGAGEALNWIILWVPDASQFMYESVKSSPDITEAVHEHV